MNVEATRHALWRHGQLHYLLHGTQIEMRSLVCRSDAAVFVVKCARRLGKTFLMCVLAIEQCLQLPGSQVHYGAPTGKAVRRMVQPNMRRILKHCPPDLLPSFHTQDGVWTFPNGSQIHIAGVNNDHADDLRGTETHLGIVDEAGFVDDLQYLVDSVLEPQLLTTNGRIIIVSTPSRTPAHAFSLFCTKAEAEGAFVVKTIFDAPHIPRERAERFIEKAGGRMSSTVRREYFCEDVVDASSAVFPEWESVAKDIVKERERPQYCKKYIVADVGFSDLTVCLFVHVDYPGALAVIEDEVWFRGKTSGVIDAGCKAKEEELWGDGADVDRVSNATPMEVAELSKRGRRWRPVRHPSFDAGLNTARTWLKEKRVRINPRCHMLRAHLRGAIWNSQRTDFYRVKEDDEDDSVVEIPLGHFDAAAAFAYIPRVIDLRSDPAPELPPGTTPDTHHIRASRKGPDQMTAIFRPMERRR